MPSFLPRESSHLMLGGWGLGVFWLLSLHYSDQVKSQPAQVLRGTIGGVAHRREGSW